MAHGLLGPWALERPTHTRARALGPMGPGSKQALGPNGPWAQTGPVPKLEQQVLPLGWQKRNNPLQTTMQFMITLSEQPVTCHS